jgi:glutaredoxin
MKLNLPLSLTMALVLLCQPAAWALYKVVGPDGKVSYTDRPPATSGKQAASPKVQTLSTGGSATAGLPYELAQVAQRFPVILYGFTACTGCDQGRQFLKQRGIPFTEKSVNSQADLQAFELLSGSRQMPLLRIGKQQITGYSSSEWNSYLDAAGYPAQSALPKGYAWPTATPMVAASATTTTDTPTGNTSPDRKTPPRVPSSNPDPLNKPSGFRF